MSTRHTDETIPIVDDGHAPVVVERMHREVMNHLDEMDSDGVVCVRHNSFLFVDASLSLCRVHSHLKGVMRRT